MERQGKTHLLPFKNWTYPVGPYLCVILNCAIVLAQGWSCFGPRFDAVSFVTYYAELPIMVVVYVAWKLIKGTRFVRLDEMDLETDTYVADEEKKDDERGWKATARTVLAWLL